MTTEKSESIQKVRGNDARDVPVFKSLAHSLSESLVIVSKVPHWFPVSPRVPINALSVIRHHQIIWKGSIMHLSKGLTVFMTERYS